MRKPEMLIGLCMTLAVVALLVAPAVAQTQMPQTTTETTKGEATVTTEQMSGQVVKDEG